MRSQGTEHSGAKHVIEVNYALREDTFSYINKVAHDVDHLLSGPESALLINDLYDDEFGLSEPTIANELIGPILYRELESSKDFNRYDSLVELYLKFDINKFYGLSINEFLSHTKYGREVLVNKAEEKMKAISDKLKDIESDENNFLEDFRET